MWQRLPVVSHHLFSFSSSAIEPLTFSCVYRASLVAQGLKRLPPMRETRVRSSNAGDPGLVPGEDPWRRKWQSTPVFLPGEPHGQRSLVGYSPRGPKESDTTERLHLTLASAFVLSAFFCQSCQCSFHQRNNII